MGFSVNLLGWFAGLANEKLVKFKPELCGRCMSTGFFLFGWPSGGGKVLFGGGK